MIISKESDLEGIEHLSCGDLTFVGTYNLLECIGRNCFNFCLIVYIMIHLEEEY